MHVIHICSYFFHWLANVSRFFFSVSPVCRCLTKLWLCAGVANALDLTDRILPRLQARPHCRPQLLHFSPYSRQELTAIVQDRLTQVNTVNLWFLFFFPNLIHRLCSGVLFSPQASANGILDASAVQFCARKVSAVSGDARKALDICR